MRALPLRPGLWSTNRDWFIPIECHRDAVILSATGRRFTPAELQPGPDGTNALLAAVQQMIARRQATVRPGELLYRPMVRFRVWPDAWRSYYLAYPALEGLGVPMTRENVNPEDDKVTR